MTENIEQSTISTTNTTLVHSNAQTTTTTTSDAQITVKTIPKRNSLVNFIVSFSVFFTILVFALLVAAIATHPEILGIFYYVTYCGFFAQHSLQCLG